MSDSLSDDHITELRSAFESFDVDGNGSITVEELGLAMRSIGQNPSTKEVRQIIEEADLDGNGTIEFEEFVKIVQAKLTDIDVVAELKEAFDVFDQDGDGFLNKEDIRVAMAGLNVTLTDKELDEMLKVADKNEDGHLNYKEFVAMLTRDDQYAADNVLLSLKPSLTI